MARVLAKPVRKAPQSLARVRLSNPFSRGLVGAFTPYTANATRVGNAVLNMGVDGLGFTTPTFGTYWQASPTALISLSPTWTILAVLNGTQTSVPNGAALYSERPNGTQIVKLIVGDSGGNKLGLVVRDLSSNLAYFNGTNTDVTSGPGSRVLVGTRRASNDHRIYINGLLERADTTNVSGSFAATDGSIGEDTQDSDSPLTTASLPLILLWDRSLSDEEIQQISANPWQVFRAKERVPFWTGPIPSSGTTYPITPSGGVAFAGAPTIAHGRAFPVSGGVAFSGTYTLRRGEVFPATGGFVLTGTAANIRGRVQVPSGGVTFGGTAPISTAATYTITPTGGVVFGGTSPEIRGRVQVASGGVAFSGAVTFIHGRAFTPTGGVVFSGTAALFKTNIFGVSGGVVFSGTAPITFNGSTPSGGLAKYLPLRGVG